MEIGAVVQRHKLALLRDGYVEQLGNQNLVNRCVVVEGAKIINQKLPRG